MADGGRRRRDDGDSWLFRHVDLRLAAGERIAIEGRSGAGKTVLLRSIVLLDPLDEGSVTWHGRALSPEAVPEFRSQVLYLHQTPSLWEGSVEDNLRLPFALRCHRGRTFQRQDAVSILHHFGRDESFLLKLQSDLSGGEAQLVALTRALLLEPAVLLLDEPTAGLDAEATAAVEELILGWSRRRPEAGSYLWICHDEAQRQRVGDRRWVVDDGALLTGDER